METFRFKLRPARENHWASFDIRSLEKTSDMLAPAQPANNGASNATGSKSFRWEELLRTFNRPCVLREVYPRPCPTIDLRHDHDRHRSDGVEGGGECLYR